MLGDASVHDYHHFTGDVEEFFSVVALQRFVPRDRLETPKSRVEGAIDRFLTLLNV